MTNIPLLGYCDMPTDGHNFGPMPELQPFILPTNPSGCPGCSCFNMTIETKSKGKKKCCKKYKRGKRCSSCPKANSN